MLHEGEPKRKNEPIKIPVTVVPAGEDYLPQRFKKVFQEGKVKELPTVVLQRLVLTQISKDWNKICASLE